MLGNNLYASLWTQRQRTCHKQSEVLNRESMWKRFHNAGLKHLPRDCDILYGAFQEVSRHTNANHVYKHHNLAHMGTPSSFLTCPVAAPQGRQQHTLSDPSISTIIHTATWCRYKKSNIRDTFSFTTTQGTTIFLIVNTKKVCWCIQWYVVKDLGPMLKRTCNIAAAVSLLRLKLKYGSPSQMIVPKNVFHRDR